MRKQFKHDDVKTAFYKLMNNTPYEKTIENVARRTNIRLLNEINKARKLTEKQHCVDFRVFDGHVTPPEEQVEAAAAVEQWQKEALVGILMWKLNHFINKPFANGVCLLKYSKLKMYVIVIKYNNILPSIIYTVLQFHELVRKGFWMVSDREPTLLNRATKPILSSYLNLKFKEC